MKLAARKNLWLNASVAAALTGLILGCGSEINLVPLESRFDLDELEYLMPVENVKPVKGTQGIRAYQCGECHRAIYQEWSQSSHALALRNLQFIAELAKPRTPKWICLNCHIPVLNQREYSVAMLVNGDILLPVKKGNPRFDRHFQKEGVTCAACHIRMDAKTGESIIMSASLSKNAPHPVQADSEFLRKLCLRCHEPEEGIANQFISTFRPHAEAAEHNRQISEKFGKEMDCVDCHMPEQIRQVSETAKSSPPRLSHRHTWTGSPIPKWYSGYEELQKKGLPSGLLARVTFPDKPAADSTVDIIVALKNDSAGHHLPTGNPEKFLLLVASLENQYGRVISEKKFRIGQNWQWRPIKKLSDNRIHMSEERIYKIPMSLPGGLAGLKFSVKVLIGRMSGTGLAEIKKRSGINEKYLPNAKKMVANIEQHYPMATYLHAEEMQLKSGKKKIFSVPELIELSKGERYLKNRYY